MPKSVRFKCPHCHTSFSILWKTDHFCCSSCHQDFAVVSLGRGRRGWIHIPDGQTLGGAWSKAITQEVHGFEKSGLKRPRKKEAIAMEAPSLGAARARREKRRASQRRNPSPGLVIAGLFVLVVSVLIFPFVAKGSPAEFEGESTEEVAASQEAMSIVVRPSLPENSVTPSPTKTPMPTNTPSPTATPLPQKLIVATIWQATLDQATFNSHATQTQSVTNYLATQTALPFTVTAAANYRAATATQKAIAATEKASP